MFQNPFLRNVATVAAGTAGAQAITMAFAPLITRLYGPEAIGLLGMFGAMVAIVVPVAALAYPIAIVLPRDDREARALVRLSLRLSLVIALLVSLVIWLSHETIVSVLDTESIEDYLPLIALAMLFSAWVQIGQQWLFRCKSFTVTARVAVVHALVLNTAKAGIGLVYPAAATLIVLATAGLALNAIMLALGARTAPCTRETNASNGMPALGKMATQYRDFPLYRAPQNLINAASQSVPILMLAAFFGPVAAGFYSIGIMLLGIPSTLLGKAVGDVFYPRISDAANSGENLSRLILRATGAMACIGILPFGLVVLFGPLLFGVVFGDEWSYAGEYARWLAVFYFFNFINKPSVAAVPVLRIQRGLLIYEVGSTGGKLIGLVAGFYVYASDVTAVALFSIIGVVAYIAMIAWIIQTARTRDDANKTGR